MGATIAHGSTLNKLARQTKGQCPCCSVEQRQRRARAHSHTHTHLLRPALVKSRCTLLHRGTWTVARYNPLEEMSLRALVSPR
jgi:hypothetical protein